MEPKWHAVQGQELAFYRSAISICYRDIQSAETRRTTRQTKGQTNKTQSKSDHLNEIPDVGIECDLHHRDHRHILGETKREHNHNIKTNKQT